MEDLADSGASKAISDAKLEADRACIHYLRTMIEYEGVAGKIPTYKAVYEELQGREFESAFDYDVLYLSTYLDAILNHVPTERQADLFCRLVNEYSDKNEVIEMAEKRYQLCQSMNIGESRNASPLKRMYDVVVKNGLAK